MVTEYKDWAAIHEREFAKMDSLDVYLEKREERRRRLKTPVKRAAAFAAKLTSGQQQPDTTKVCTVLKLEVTGHCDQCCFNAHLQCLNMNATLWCAFTDHVYAAWDKNCTVFFKFITPVGDDVERLSRICTS